MRIPVHKPLTAVDQTVLEEFEERFAHRPRAHVIQREAGAVPVAGAAHALKLLDDAISILLLPLPDALYQSFAADIMAGFVFLLLELLFHHRLRGDSGMVDPRNPKRIKPAHAVRAD